MIGRGAKLGLAAVLMNPTATSPSPAAAHDAPPVVARTQQVRIESAPGVVLAGELIIPLAAKAPVPAVLLLGGGGASPHGIYPMLEARLHAKGIATLSFDKRGIGQSTGAFVDAIDPMTRDARAALGYLRSRRDAIQADRVAVLGLSQGAVIAPTLAIDAPGIAAIVLLAGPIGARGTLFLNEMRVKLTGAGMAASAADGVVGATKRYLDALTRGGPPEGIASARRQLVGAFVAAGWRQDLAEGAVTTLSEPATASLYTVATRDVLSRVRAPVLAIYAADDTTVSSALSLPEARRALRRNGDATIVVMPGVDHGFKPRVAGPGGEPTYRGWPVSDPATLTLIDDWLSRRLLAAPR